MSRISVYLETVDTSVIPEELAFIVESAQYFFMTLTVATGSGYLRSISGFIIKVIKSKRTESPEAVDYSMAWTLETVGKFEMVLVLATPFFELLVPPVYKPLAMTALAGLFAFIDIMYSETKTLIAAVKKPG